MTSLLLFCLQAYAGTVGQFAGADFKLVLRPSGQKIQVCYAQLERGVLKESGSEYLKGCFQGIEPFTGPLVCDFAGKPMVVEKKAVVSAVSTMWWRSTWAADAFRFARGGLNALLIGDNYLAAYGKLADAHPHLLASEETEIRGLPMTLNLILDALASSQEDLSGGSAPFTIHEPEAVKGPECP